MAVSISATNLAMLSRAGIPHWAAAVSLGIIVVGVIWVLISRTQE